MHIETIIRKVLAAAEEARTNAGYSGSWGDGGAAQMEAEVQFYRAGQAQEIPRSWMKYATEAEQEADPEHAEYLRLKKKFG